MRPPYPSGKRSRYFKKKGIKMETQFIYLKEDAKFWIVSSVVGLAILILVFLSGTANNNHAGIGDVNAGEIKYYSKILGVVPAEDRWPGDIFRVDIQRWNKWQRGGTAYAANIR
ncbi:MAG: hypothetical protein JSW64_02040 [Candidatus Zixiibacteriota bacterium]|nr:MAG: hypothetical protein JSW64_02040 [candidate division Zixibacteria bacterium]